jgi:hypothetical protein
MEVGSRDSESPDEMNGTLFKALQASVKDKFLTSIGDTASRMRLLRLVDALGQVAAVLGSIVPERGTTTWKKYVECLITSCKEGSDAVKSAAEEIDEGCSRDIQAALEAVRSSIPVNRGEASPYPPLPTHTPTLANGPAFFAGGVCADTARFGASAPVSTQPGSEFVARFTAYGDGQQAAAQELLRLDSANVGGVMVGSQHVTLGTIIEVALSGTGLTVDGCVRSVQSFKWIGEPVLLTFAVCTGDLKDHRSTVLRFDVMIAGIVLARVALEVGITTAPDSGRQQVDGYALARKAFASYSSKDRRRVLERVASIRLAAAVEVFVDRVDLKPGELWEKRLKQEIDACDLFLLFWSQSAADSRWVRMEWKRALTKRGLDHMRFHPLSNNVKAPPELAAIHLKDPYIDLILATPNPVSMEQSEGGS